MARYSDEKKKKNPSGQGTNLLPVLQLIMDNYFPSEVEGNRPDVKNMHVQSVYVLCISVENVVAISGKGWAVGEYH